MRAASPRKLTAVAIALLLALLIGMFLRARTEPRADEIPPDGAVQQADAGSAPHAPRETAPAPERLAAETVGAPVRRRISGQLLLPDRSGAEHCSLVLTDPTGKSEVALTWHVETTAGGAFAFEDLLPGTYLVSADLDAVTARVELRADADVEDLELILPASRGVIVTVVDARGAAVAGARVILLNNWGNSFGPTDASGRVRLTTFSGDVVAQVVGLSDKDRLFLLPPAVPVVPGQREVRFVLEEAGIATGMVLSPGGRPVSLLLFTAKDRRVLASVGCHKGRFELPVPLEGTASIVLDLDGGTREITEAGETKPTRVTGRLDGVCAGDRNLVLQLVAVPADRSLRVLVESPSGAPVEGARVLLVEAAGGYATGYTDALGMASFDGLYAGAHEIRVLLREQDPATADLLTGGLRGVIPAGQEVVVRLRQGVRLKGVVLRPDGEPCPGAIVASANPRPDCTRTKAGNGGAFEFLLDPDNPDHLDLRALIDRDGEFYYGEANWVDPRAGVITIRLSRDP